MLGLDDACPIAAELTRDLDAGVEPSALHGRAGADCGPVLPYRLYRHSQWRHRQGGEPAR
jgi:hypothetical protein